MTFDDIPLIQIEKEVFAECGAWKNFLELEDSLSLDELVELYDIALERQRRLVKVIGAALGAEFEDDEPSHSYEHNGQRTGNVGPIVNAEDAARLPIGLGYSKIE